MTVSNTDMEAKLQALLGEALTKKLLADTTKATDSLDTQLRDAVVRSSQERKSLIKDDVDEPRFGESMQAEALSMVFEVYCRQLICVLLKITCETAYASHTRMSEFIAHAAAHFEYAEEDVKSKVLQHFIDGVASVQMRKQAEENGPNN